MRYCREFLLTNILRMKEIMSIILLLFVFLRVTAPTSTVHYFYIVESEPIYKGFNQYADDLGWYESRNNPRKMPNSIGCFAEHQWKQSTLAYLGYKDITMQRFRKDPGIFPRKMQLEALKALIDTNKVHLEPYKFYIGRIIAGVRITQSGLIGAAHLGGYNSVILFLESNGKRNKKDRNGTSIKDYIELFEGYKL